MVYVTELYLCMSVTVCSSVCAQLSLFFFEHKDSNAEVSSPLINLCFFNAAHLIKLFKRDCEILRRDYLLPGECLELTRVLHTIEEAATNRPYCIRQDRYMMLLAHSHQPYDPQ